MSQQLLDTYKSLLTSLWDRMAAMLGRITTHSLMERALFETGKEAPLTRNIILHSHGIDLSNLEAKADAVDAAELRDSMNALVVNLVGVLAEQVGRTIAEQIAKKAVVPIDQEAE